MMSWKAFSTFKLLLLKITRNDIMVSTVGWLYKLKREMQSKGDVMKRKEGDIREIM